MQPIRAREVSTAHPAPLLRAAEYVRMSTEHQQYSTVNQRAKIHEYAAQHGIQIVQSYADEGKSGLRIDGRPALQRLISDVESGVADYQIILVFDVSRWGRFQDADESAYYEFICRRAGIQVIYCAEQFENDGSPLSTIVKGIKRAMAGEYSRELSAKVFAGQCRLIQMGYHQGGSPGFGLRRLLVDPQGKIKGQLSPGEYKSIATDHVILVPGPDDEIRLVNDIFRWFVNEGLYERVIAARLNSMNILTDRGQRWTIPVVHRMLTNEKYIGNNVYGRTSSKLKTSRRGTAPDMWTKREGAFSPIVPPEVFHAVQRKLRKKPRCSTAQMVEYLQTLYQSHGWLSQRMIEQTEGMPDRKTYVRRFGSLLSTYQAVGYVPAGKYRYREVRQSFEQLCLIAMEQAEHFIKRSGGTAEPGPLANSLQINGEILISFVVAPCKTSSIRNLHWKAWFNPHARPDIVIVLRLDQSNRSALDYFLFPRMILRRNSIKLAMFNAIELECYRSDTLDRLSDMTSRVNLRRLT